jgi:uncharacterized protein YdaU (DUF1376 family)
MKLFWGDYHKATRHLRRDQHGAYFLLIGEAWRLGGSLPDDDDLLAAWALCTPEEWAPMKPIIMAFFVMRRGKWVHDRVREELAHYDDVSRKRKSSGKTGGSSSSGKQRGKRTAIANQLPTKPEPESEPDKIDAAVAREDDWPSGGMDAWRPALHAIAGPGLADPAKEPGLFTTAGELVRWRQAGCSWELDVLPVIQGKTQRARGSPIRTWPLFTEAIMAAKARRLSPLIEPEIQHGQGGYSERGGRPSAAEVNLAAAARAVAKRRGDDRGGEDGGGGPSRLALPRG